MQSLKEHIENNRFENVFEELKDIVKNDKIKTDEITVIHGRYNELIRQKRMDTLELSEIMRHTNKLRIDILEFISDLEGYQNPLRKEYDKHLSNLYNVPDLFNNKILLSQLYVQPYFNVYHSAFNISDEKLNKEKRKDYKKKDYVFIEESLSKIICEILEGINPLKLKEDLSTPSFILLLGQPGQGKSSFCRRLLHDYIACPTLNDSQPIYFIRLRDIRNAEDLYKDPLITLKEQIENDISRRIGEKMPISEKDFYKGTLILDGLDELEMVKGNSFNEDHVIRFCQTLNDQIYQCNRNKHPIRVIITSRHGRINANDLSKRNILIFQLGELTVLQQHNWLSNFKKNGGTTWLNQEHIDKYQTDKDAYSHLAELMEQPILLNMIAQLDDEPNTKADRSLLYDRLFDILINRAWDEGKTLKIHEDMQITPQLLRQLIQETAFAVFKSGREYVHKEVLINSLSPKLKIFFEKAENNAEKGYYLQRLMMSFYVQSTPKSQDDDFKGALFNSDYAIEFVHKSLMEFLVAEYLWNVINERMFAKNSVTKDYIINNSTSCLEFIGPLFDKQALSIQIIVHLDGFIKNADNKLKKLLFYRFNAFLPDMLAWDFCIYRRLTSYFKQSLNIFFGFWTIFSRLDDGLNKAFVGLGQNKISKLFDFIRIGQFYNLVLRNIEFNDDIFTGSVFNNIDFSGCKFKKIEMGNVVFSECKFDNVIFQDIGFINCWFHVEELRFVTFSGCYFYNCVFSNDNFIKSIEKNKRLNNADVERINVDFNMTNFKKTIFSNCQINKEQIVLLKSKDVYIE